MLTDYPRHVRTFDYLGLHRYFLTFCTFWRRPHFTDAQSVSLVSGEILRAADRERFAITAYCFMPDHVHLLVEATSDCSDGRRFIARAKQLSGFAFKRERHEPLWQRYGYEHTLRRDDAVLAVARYILENPVRAGLVASPQDYPYSACHHYSVSEILEASAWRPR